MAEGTPLPRIGAPATRALAHMGVTTLEDVSGHRADELLERHGVGPTAIRLLEEAMAEHGLAFAGGERGHAGPQPLSDEVRHYVDGLPASHRPLFDRLHALILDEVPEAEVVISYKIPLYRVGRRHVGLNPRRADGITLTATSPDHIAEFRRRHPEVRTGKASIQLRLDGDVPEDDLRDVIRKAVRT
jgi:uncharacterized protein YdhG (YjbR/CyaY superfamily)